MSSIFSSLFMAFALFSFLGMLLYSLLLSHRLQNAARPKVIRLKRERAILILLFAVFIVLSNVMEELSRGYPFNLELIGLAFFGALIKYTVFSPFLVLDVYCNFSKIRKRLRELDALAAPPPAPPGG